MEPTRSEVGVASIGWLWRRIVCVLAPHDERDEILDDLAEEASHVSASHGRRAARRLIRWQVLHSIGPWTQRRARESTLHIQRMFAMLYRGLWPDIRLATRRLRQSRGFTALAIVSLAIGIGAVSTVFSLAHALWLKPLPWFEPERVVSIHARHEASASSASLTAVEVAAYQRDSGTLSALAAFSYGAGIAKVDGAPVRIVAYRVSPNLFQLLGVRPAMGRDFVGADAVEGAHAVMLSHGTWVKRFASDPKVVGKSLSMNGDSYTIIGVMPWGFSFPRGLASEVWLPVNIAGGTNATSRVYQTVARLAPGRSLDEATAEVRTKASTLAQTFPVSNTGWGAMVIPAGVTTSESSRLAFQALLGLVGLFLVIACTNLAGLMIARNAGRRAELAVCVSLGAPRWRLARSLLVESALLAGAGCAAGVLLSSFGARLLSSFLPKNTPGLDEVVLNVPVLGVAVGVAVLSAMVVGLLPALSLRSVRASEAVAGSRSVTGATSLAQRSVVVVEIVLAVVLLVGATAMLASFAAARDRDRGYDPRGLQALNVSLPFADGSYRPTARRAIAFNELLAGIARVPGVRSVAATTGFPGSQLGILGVAMLTPPGSTTPRSAALHAASVDYFDTMGIPLKAGRAFTAADTTGAPGVMLVNEMVAASFPDGNPIGQHVPLSILGDTETLFEIVGVVGNIRLGERATSRVFVPLNQASPYWVDVVFRSEPGAKTMPAVRQALRSLNPELLLENESSFQSIITDSLVLERAQSVFAALVGLLSTVVAAVGLYALMTFVAAQRRREFGIRLALGSQPRQLFQGAMTRALRLAGVGVVLGVIVAWSTVRLLSSRVFGLTAAGFDAYTIAAAIVLVVAMAAAWIPARRVMRTDPLTALRN